MSQEKSTNTASRVPLGAKPEQGSGWISHNVNCRGVQARMTRNGKPYSRSFAFGKYGDPTGAEQAAWTWLGEVGKQHPKNPGLRLSPQTNKRQSCPPGVSYGGSGGCYRFQVYWKDDKRKPRNKTFHAGTDATLTDAEWRQAKAAAFAFRYEYEQAVKSGRSFDAAKWGDWRGRITALQAQGIEYAKPNQHSEQNHCGKQ